MIGNAGQWRGRGTSAARRGLVTLAVLAAWALVSIPGCSRPQEPGGGDTTGAETQGMPAGGPTVAAGGCARDPSATEVQITKTPEGKYLVTEGHLPLRRSARDRFQWHNKTGDDLCAVFKNTQGVESQPLTELLPSNGWSSVRWACFSCSPGIYEYRLYRRNASGQWEEAPNGNGPPTEPEVSVQ